MLNSVVQYFPNAGYLVDVIDAALRLLAPGGALYVGDVRNLALLREFATGVQLEGADADDTAAVMRERVRREMLGERELLLAPEFFVALPQRLSEIGAVDVQLKRMRSVNELSRYRYEVVLRKAPVVTRSVAEVPAVPWERFGEPSRARGASTLRAPRTSVRVTGIPHAGLAAEVAAARALDGPPIMYAVADLVVDARGRQGRCLPGSAGCWPELRIHGRGDLVADCRVDGCGVTSTAPIRAVSGVRGVLPAGPLGALAEYVNDPGANDRVERGSAFRGGAVAGVHGAGGGGAVGAVAGDGEREGGSAGVAGAGFRGGSKRVPGGVDAGGADRGGVVRAGVGGGAGGGGRRLLRVGWAFVVGDPVGGADPHRVGGGGADSGGVRCADGGGVGGVVGGGGAWPGAGGVDRAAASGVGAGVVCAAADVVHPPLRGGVGDLQHSGRVAVAGPAGHRGAGCGVHRCGGSARGAAHGVLRGRGGAVPARAADRGGGGADAGERGRLRAAGRGGGRGGAVPVRPGRGGAAAGAAVPGVGRRARAGGGGASHRRGRGVDGAVGAGSGRGVRGAGGRSGAGVGAAAGAVRRLHVVAA